MKEKILITGLLAFLLALPLAYAVDDYCVYCGEKEYTFTKTGLDLGTSNTLKIVGHDSHGITYIQIDCSIEDTGPPDTTINPNGVSWRNSNVPFTLTCVDDSGCQTTYYKIINSGSSCGTTGFSTGTSGSVTCASGQVCNKAVCFYSVDTVGNTEAMNTSGVFRIDKTKPSTSIALSGTSGLNNWYISDVQVTLTCSDTGSGCNSIEYCIDTSNTCTPANTYSSPFSVSYEGTSYVRYRSKDKAGNTETTKSRQLKIDKTNPSTSIDPNGTTNWVNSNVGFGLTCSDSVSLCSSTYYKLINDGDMCGTSGFTSGNSGSVTCGQGQVCNKRVCFFSKDNAGREEATQKSGVFRIDKEKPTVSVTGNPQNWQNVDVDAYVLCNDLGSGKDDNSYRLKVYTSNPGSCPTGYSQYDKPSPYTISEYSWVCGVAKDNVGNLGVSSPIEFKIDKNPPTPSFLKPATSVTNSSVGLEWSKNSDLDFSYYEVHYSQTEGFIPVEQTIVTAINDRDTTTFDVTGLEKETTYYFKIVSFDLTQMKSISNEISENTRACNPGEQRPCGSNIGECSSGTRTCNENGEWGECIGYVGPKNETCNGLDDDCDSVTDNIGGKSSVEETKCACYNDYVVPNESSEICNAIDDDCNEEIDDGINCECINGRTKPCGSNIGECSNGTSTCIDGEWGDCIGSVGPKGETCNGKDDDCDGTIDNIDGKNSTLETKCACFDNASLPYQLYEICNGIDDDCNEEIDDGIDCNCTEGETRSCGSNIGECSNGTSTCIDGEWGLCIGSVGPGTERCNGKDNDCDGTIDNIFGGGSVEETRCACYNNQSVPGENSETCNGIDDDCNEEIDDGINCGCFEGSKNPCGSNIGICESGERTCVNGEWGDCIGSVGPKGEMCNGKDDDCDGTVDNVFGENSVEKTKCACYNGFSTPGTKAETCNDIDDNCDGRVDEGCPGVTVGPPGSTCNNGVMDGDELGIDCGGSCPKICPQPPELSEWAWVLVFLVLVTTIVVVWIIILMFERENK